MQNMTVAEAMPELRGELKLNEPMSAHTSWRAGGPADRCYRPADLADLQQFLATLPDDEMVIWVGLGSNLLVRDGGIRGTVILPFGITSTCASGPNLARAASSACCRS